MQNRLTQLFVGSIMLIIIFFYWRTELRPFEYSGYDLQFSRFEQYNAQLDEAVVQTRFGLIRHYDSINRALNGLHEVTDEFDRQLAESPDPKLTLKLDELKTVLAEKELLVEQFKRSNPILRNAIQDFSDLMSQIIEAEAHLELIESCFDAEIRYSLIDDVNNLFRGVLVYTNAPTPQKRERLITLIEEIRNQPESLDNLPKALIYGTVVLEKLPKLNRLNVEILDLPISERMEGLQVEFKEVFAQHQDRLDQSRFFLYGLSLLLLIVLHFAFKRLQDTVRRLQVEIELKNEAQGELAQINRELEQRVADRTRDLAEKNDDLNTALHDLEEAQDRLIMQEKMASVGMLTTGVAHEIKNPLNFINNFSDISVDLVDELKEELDNHTDKLSEDARSYLNEILEDLKTNCEKISHHGSRADNIVKNMLMHSESGGVQKEMVNINQLLEDNINIAYESQKGAQDSFECDIVRDFSDELEKILIVPQAMGQVFNYLLSNSFYAVNEKLNANPGYKPTVKVTTTKVGEHCEIKFYDNGTGIPEEHLKKIFEPFYTTKPTGRGNTGLGLSICYDTVVKQHKGELSVNSKLSEFTEFTLVIPIVQSGTS